MVSYNKRHVVFAVSIIVTMLTLVHLGFVVGIFGVMDKINGFLADMLSNGQN
jgi:hypothetical protein